MFIKPRGAENFCTVGTKTAEMLPSPLFRSTLSLPQGILLS